MLGDNLCLIMLTVENKSFKECQFSSLDQRLSADIIKKRGTQVRQSTSHTVKLERRKEQKLLTVSRSRDLRIGLTKTDLLSC